MVEVFVTNIELEAEAEKVVKKLTSLYPDFQITMDLDDCDNILRVEGDEVFPEKIEKAVHSLNFEAKRLD